MTVYEQLVEEGRKKGGADILLNQLATRFGPLPADVTERVKHADLAELTAWSTRVLTAATLAETLEAPPARKGTRRSPKARS